MWNHSLPSWKILFFLGGLCAILSFSNSVRGDERPNIIFILADDLGAGEIGAFGGTVAKTPNLDKMAAEGTRFERYYSASPICSPSRCGLITGNFPARWKINSYLQTRAGNKACEMADFLDPAAPSLPRILKSSGYATAHFGKWHLGGGRDVANPPKFAAYGYDEHASTWESPEPHPDLTAGNWVWSKMDKVKRWDRTAFFLDKTMDFLGQNKGKPCFVNVWLDDPHSPWVPSDEAIDKKTGSEANLKKVMEETDKQVGRFLDGLKKAGLDNNTLVIFASDNGPLPTFQGKRTNGLKGAKLCLYEGGIRLPLIAWWPGKVPARRVDSQTVISAVDILPSLCAIAGATVPTNLPLGQDGINRSGALLGKSDPNRSTPLFWEYGRNTKSFDYPKKYGSESSPWLAVLDGPWKLLCMPDGSETQLYQVFEDPKETKNLAADHPELVDRLKTRLLSWKKSLP